VGWVPGCGDLASLDLKVECSWTRPSKMDRGVLRSSSPFPGGGRLSSLCLSCKDQTEKKKRHRPEALVVGNAVLKGRPEARMRVPGRPRRLDPPGRGKGL
jgi:hypothetical protein